MDDGKLFTWGKTLSIDPECSSPGLSIRVESLSLRVRREFGVHAGPLRDRQEFLEITGRRDRYPCASAGRAENPLVMGNLILITGGCRSGKSRYAVERVKQTSEKALYVATCQPSDAEMHQRVEKHRGERPVDWDTLENRWDLDQVLLEKEGQYSCILLDCVTMWVSYLLTRGESDTEILEKADRFIAAIETVGATRRVAPTIIAVTNEVGWGVVPESESGRRFRDLAGMVNQKLAQAADEVILMVAGIPVSVGADLRVCPNETA